MRLNWVWAACVGLSASLLQAEQTGTPRRVVAGDYSKNLLAMIGPDGRIEWRQKIGSIHDVSVLENGNILFQNGWNRIIEMTREGKIVWEYDASTANGNKGKKVEVHAVQRLADGLTMLAESGTARIIEVDQQGRIHKEVKLTVEHPSAHSDTRHVRKLANGNYLVAHEADGKAREYDGTGKVVWEYEVPMFGREAKPGHGPEAFGNKLFSAVRLANGNTLIGTGNGHSVIEVTAEKQIVWKLDQNDLPGIQLAWVCRVERLAGGNTFLVNCHAGPENPQLIEVTADKKVVWTFKDQENFGNATSVGLVLP